MFKSKKGVSFALLFCKQLRSFYYWVLNQSKINHHTLSQQRPNKQLMIVNHWFATNQLSNVCTANKLSTCPVCQFWVCMMILKFCTPTQLKHSHPVHYSVSDACSMPTRKLSISNCRTFCTLIASISASNSRWETSNCNLTNPAFCSLCRPGSVLAGPQCAAGTKFGFQIGFIATLAIF